MIVIMFASIESTRLAMFSTAVYFLSFFPFFCPLGWRAQSIRRFRLSLFFLILSFSPSKLYLSYLLAFLKQKK